MAEATCYFCGEPLNSASPRVRREVEGWWSFETGEFVQTDVTGRYAHGRCAAERELAAPATESAFARIVGRRPRGHFGEEQSSAVDASVSACEEDDMQEPSETISTAALRSEDVPASDGPLEGWIRGKPPALWQFAATYVPPADFPCADKLGAFVTEAAVRQWSETGGLPEIGLGGLRLTLWWLFQQWRHTQAEGPWEATYPQYAGYARASVDQIRLEVYREQSWWWDPGHTPTDAERDKSARARANETGAVSELYALAADVLNEAIALRDAGGEDPFNLPLIESDLVRAAKVHAAYLLARGLTGGGRSLEEAREVASARAAMT
jgi:hypothetical protein